MSTSVSNPEAVTPEEQLLKVREPIPFTPTKRLQRDDVLYVTEEDIPHPLYGYARSHKEYSVIDLRGYRKGYEPRLEIRGIYTPNPEDIFRVGTGKLPPYQPTTTGDELLAEMRRLGVHKAFRIDKPSPMAAGGNPLVMMTEPWQMTRGEYRVAKEKLEDAHYEKVKVWLAEFKGDPNARYSQAELEKERPDLAEEYKTLRVDHHELVKRAIEEGKPVPPEVLKDYPDLAKKHSTPEAVPAVPEVSSEVLEALRLAHTERPRAVGAQLDYDKALSEAIRKVSEKGEYVRYLELLHTEEGYRLTEAKPPAEDILDLTKGEMMEIPLDASGKAIPPEEGNPDRVRFDRADIDSAIAAAKRLESEKDLYVFATHLGYTIDRRPPPGMQSYVIVRPDGTTETVKPLRGNPIPDEELDLARTLAIIDSRPKGRIIESKLREEFGDAVIDALRQGRYVVSGSAGYNPPLLVSLKGRELIQGGNPERVGPEAVVRYKRNYGVGKSVFFVEYEYGGERYITGTVIRGTDRSLGWYFGKGKEGLREANRIALLSDEEFSKAEDLKKYSWRETLKSISEAKPPAVEEAKEGSNPTGKVITKEEAIGLLERLSMTPGEAARSLVADEAERREIIQTVQQRVKGEQNKWAPFDPREGPPLPRIFAGLRWPWRKP